jgi:hypothetical protein
MRILFIILLLVPFVGKTQQTQDTLWGSKKFRFGITIQSGAALWKQKNFNSILLQNNLPTARDFTSAVSLGDILQWNKLRLTALVVIWRNKSSANSQNLEQTFGGGELNAEYFIIRKKGFSLSPLIGGGILNGITRVRQNAIAQTFSNALANRGTTELFNRQGYINGAINFGFCYAPRLKDHLFQAALGYRIGFANTNWSTDPKAEILTGTTSDALRQFYLTLKLNFLFMDKRNKT